MEKKRRAERLIAFMRWPVLVIGLAAIADEMSWASRLWLMVVLVVYNSAVTLCLSNNYLFARCARRISDVCRVVDTGAITIALTSCSKSGSPAWLLYWFVLVASGYSSASLRRLLYDSSIVFTANTFATFYAGNVFGWPVGAVGYALAIRSAGIVLGALVALYVAKIRSQEELASERRSYLQAILDCGTRLTSFRSVHDLAAHVLQSAVTHTGATGGELLLVDEESGKLECEAFYAAGSHSLVGSAPSDSVIRSYANWVVNTGKEFVVRTSTHRGDKDAAPNPESPESDPHCAIAVPLQWQSSNGEDKFSVLGVLLVWSAPGEDFAPDALDILKIFAAIAGAAIVNLRLYTNLQKSFLRTLQSLAASLEARDEYTRGHSERVMKVASMIAEELGVPEESIEILRSAAELHDIGKIGVPDAILRKAGKLTAEEWETMRRHPIVSEEICRPLGLPPEVLFLIKHHHERLDGKGYPAGLLPEDQPLLQRILVVADSFDAMRSRRPYRDVMPEDELISELNRSAGRTMDPTVVDALKRLLERGDLAPIYEEHDRLTGVSARTSKESRRAA